MTFKRRLLPVAAPGGHALWRHRHSPPPRRHQRPRMHTKPTDAVRLPWPAAEVEALTHRNRRQARSRRSSSDHEYYYIEYVTRVVNKNAEAHNHWYDYIHVLDRARAARSPMAAPRKAAPTPATGEIRGGKPWWAARFQHPASWRPAGDPARHAAHLFTAHARPYLYLSDLQAKKFKGDMQRKIPARRGIVLAALPAIAQTAKTPLHIPGKSDGCGNLASSAMSAGQDPLGDTMKQRA